VRSAGGAKGTVVCSQIACGEDNALAIRLYGSEGSLEWRQQEPNTLIHKPKGHPWQYLRRGRDYHESAAVAATRIPPDTRKATSRPSR
jgi:predicted dehydrogenase